MEALQWSTYRETTLYVILLRLQKRGAAAASVGCVGLTSRNQRYTVHDRDRLQVVCNGQVLIFSEEQGRIFLWGCGEGLCSHMLRMGLSEAAGVLQHHASEKSFSPTNIPPLIFRHTFKRNHPDANIARLKAAQDPQSSGLPARPNTGFCKMTAYADAHWGHTKLWLAPAKPAKSACR